jgi:predicted DNA-binding protein
MAKDKWLKVRLSDEEMDKLQAYAKQKGWSMSLVVREYIKRLPKPVV